MTISNLTIQEVPSRKTNQAALEQLLAARPSPQTLPSEMTEATQDELAKLPAAPDPHHPLADDFAQLLQPARPPADSSADAWPPPRSVKVSVLIPVKNEQHNLIGCLRRLQWADEIVVIDSQSRDNTIPLAQAMGAAVYQFYYSRAGWPKKKNWALENVPWRNEWVLILDADEYCLPELAREVEQVVSGGWSHPNRAKQGCGDGFWINRRFMFMGRWIKHCGYYPSWNVRLFRHAVARYERIGELGDTGSGDNEVHEHIVLSTGAAGFLHQEFLHYAYPDLNAWIEKHNRYSTWEAHAMQAGDRGSVAPRFFGTPIERRRRLKRMTRRLPCRPTLRFLYSYIVQRGFLDGYEGLVMCKLLAWYELVSLAKHREMHNPCAQSHERNR